MLELLHQGRVVMRRHAAVGQAAQRGLGEVAPLRVGQVAKAYQAMMSRFSDIIGDVRDTSMHLTEYAAQLASTTELTREGVAVQTRETDQVATATTEMTHAIEEVSRNAHQAADAANNANQ